MDRYYRADYDDYNVPKYWEEPEIEITARCGCGAEYDWDDWNRLRLVGVQADPGWRDLELRDCARCQSTISCEIGDEP